MTGFRGVSLPIPLAGLMTVLLAVAPAMIGAQAPRIRDSAGVRIVENGPRSKAPTAFVLSAKPTFDVGGLKDNPDDELSTNGLVLSAVRLADGVTVVGDMTRVRYYDSTGRQLRFAGQSGEGPGRFRGIAAICATRGDTILAFDPGNQRITVLERDGRILGEIPTFATYLMGCLDDGTYVGLTTDAATGTTRLSRISIRGRFLGTIAATWSGKHDAFSNMGPATAAHGQWAYVGDPRVSEIRLYDANGRLRELVRTADPLEATTAAERNAMQPGIAIATSDNDRLARFNELLRTAPRPTDWPSFMRIMVDPDGRLWVEDYPKTRQAPDVWTGFDAAGKLLGKVALPPWKKRGDPTLVAFTSGGVLMQREDSDGAEHLTTYALVPAKKP